MSILEAISNNIPVLPIGTSVGQPASGHLAPGGFALTLAAAQRQSTPQPANRTVASSGVPATESGGVASNLDGRTPALGNLQAKKLTLSNPALTATNVVALNAAVPEVMPFSSSPVVSVLPPNLSQASLAPPGVSSEVSGTQFSQVGTGTVQTDLQTTAQGAVPGTLVANSVVSQNNVASGSLTGSESAGSKITNPSELTGVAPNANWKATSQESATANSVPPVVAAAPAAITPGGSLLNPSSDIPWSPAQDASGSMVSITGNDIQPNATSTREQPVADTQLPKALGDQQPNGSVTNGAGSSLPELTLASIGTVNFASSVSTIPAQATSNAGVAPPPNTVGGSEIAQHSLSTSLPPVQADLPAQTTMENSSSAIVGVPVTASPGLNPSDQLAMGRVDPRFAALKEEVTVNPPSIRGMEQHAAATSSTLIAVSTAVQGSSQQSALASQTPFSIFFSGPGPGAESAAGTLPKMILPVAGSVTGSNRNAGSDSSSVSAPTNVPQNGSTHNPAPQNLKDPAVRSESPQAGQSQRAGGDGNAASAEPAMAQIATTPAPTVTTSTVNLPVGATPLPLADPLGKTIAAPTPPGGASATVVPETTPVRMTGPVQMAQLISRVEQAEMRIGMNTSAFGSVEVRAVVHANDVGLVVGSEKGDLRTLLSTELPAIANVLQEQNLRLHSVNFMQGFAFSNNASGGGGDSQPRPFVPLRAATDLAAREARTDESNEPKATAEPSRGHNNLSILA